MVAINPSLFCRDEPRTDRPPRRPSSSPAAPRITGPPGPKHPPPPILGATICELPCRLPPKLVDETLEIAGEACDERYENLRNVCHRGRPGSGPRSRRALRAGDGSGGNP